MKNKGISLIVLIITIVVIIMLATVIIVNLAQTNIIGNANEAVVKQDFKTMQDELNLYAADKFVNNQGKFELEKLNADENGVTYTGEGTVEENSVFEILTSLKNNNKYKVSIINGKISIDESMDEQIKEWANQALESIHTKKSYTVTLEPNGADGEKEEKSITEGFTYILHEPTYTRSGYKFVGWSEEKDETSTVYSVGSSITVNNNITLYAIWSIDTITVTFNAGDSATGSMDVQTVQAGIATTLSPNQYTKEGYYFAGWKDAQGNSYTNEQEIILTKDITLTAQWLDNKIPNYGTSIQSSYSAIYKIDTEGVRTQVAASHDTYWKGNFAGKGVWSQIVNNGTRINTPTTSSKSSYTKVNAGTNTIDFTSLLSDCWIGLHFDWTVWSSSQTFGKVKLVFNDGQSLTIKEAVDNEYIEPLVMHHSMHPKSTTYVLQSPQNQLTGGTEKRSYSRWWCMFKVKNTSQLKGVSFYSSGAWTYGYNEYYDGFEAFVLNNGTEFSI